MALRLIVSQRNKSMAEMDQDGKIFVGKGDKPEFLTLALGQPARPGHRRHRHRQDRHAAGAGRGLLARRRAGVRRRHQGRPLRRRRGRARPRRPSSSAPRSIGFDYEPDQFPVVFWDLFGEQGHPIRATVSEMGPLLLSRLLDLNDVQEGVLNIAFRVADEQGLLLLDLKDLRAMLGYRRRARRRAHRRSTATSPKRPSARSSASCWCWRTRAAPSSSASRRSTLEDFMRTDRDGRGIINILAADKLMENPRLYATFLLWLLSELFEELPEVGDLDKPKLVFFFDEAHLLFNDAPKALLDKIEQVVRLIRSKGVGVYFVTQNPLDVPDKVLAQLGNRVQHALRAFTPRDQKAVRAAAETFRANPKLDTAKVITELGKGEALVSFLEGNGTPSMVERA